MATPALPLSERLRLAFIARPLAWIAAAAALGVAGGDAASGPVAAAAAVVAALFALLALRVQEEWRPPVAYLACLALACGLAAGWSCVAARPGPRDVSHLIGRRAGVIGAVVTEPARTASGRVRFLLQCEAADLAGGRVAVDGLLHVLAPARVALGGRIQLFGILQAPRPATNPGGFSEADWLRRQGVFAALRVRPYAVLAAPGPWRSGAMAAWRAGAARWRRRVTEANRRALGPEADLVNSLLFGALDVGDPQRWQDEVQRYRYAGLVHLLVVSGTQVMLFAGPLLLLLRLASGSRLGAALALAALVAAVGLYTAMAGASASVLRAAAMTLLFAGAWLLRREPDVENTLGTALLLFLIASPLALYDAGLQLSLAAVWSLARLTEPLQALLDGALPGALAAARYSRFAAGRRFVLALLAASTAATLATAPLIMHYFGEYAPVAIFANLLAVPLAALLLYAGLCGSLLNLDASSLAAPVNVVTAQLAGMLDAVARFFAGLIGGHVGVFSPGWLAVALAFAALALAAAWGRPRRGRKPARRRVALALALALLPLAWGMAVPAPAPRELEVTFLDVGQGDSALVRLPGGAVILIDGGGSPAGTFDVGQKVVLPVLRHLRVPRIDLLVLTHPHDDHLGGLVAVAEQYTVGAVLDSGQAVASANYRCFLEAVRHRRLRYLRARRGMELRWRDARLEVLHPGDILLRNTHSDLNNNSVVCRLTYGRTRFLFAGDAEGEAEALIRASGRDVSADVLKVGHHGSRFSTDDRWLAAVQPRIAVISCGRDNLFGHPARATIARLRAAGAQVFRTDEDGAVTVRCDGRRAWAEGSTAGSSARTVAER